MREARVRKGHAVLRGVVTLAATGATCLATALPGHAAPTFRAVQTFQASPAPARPHAPTPVRGFSQHQWLTAEQGVPHPLAVTVLDGSGLLAVADRPGGRTRITLLDPARDRVVGRMRVAGVRATRTLADDGHGTLAVLAGRELLTWPASARGTVRPHATRVAGTLPARTAGMSWDPAAHGWLVLDAAGHRLVRLTAAHGHLRASGGPGLGTPAGARLRGLAVDAASGLAYVGTARGRLYEVTGTGHVRRTFTVAGDRGAATLASGPSADPTDPAGLTSLYTAAAGSTAGSDPALGRVSELSLTPLGSAAALAPSVATSTATLVRKTLLSQLSPPSPDPSGIVYRSDVDRLLVVDSEVDEMSIYRSVNLWQLSRSGTASDTGNTLKFSKEPTGVGYDPVGKRIFVSDDDKGKVFEVTAGSDGRFGTSDDPVTSISTTAFGDDDAEDVTYDTRDKALYVTQGVGQEVWRVAPGPDGRFDGVAPTGDDQVSHFDVGVYGITDLEGIGYSPARDSLFLMDRKYTQVVEVTTTGALVQKIDVSAIGMKNPAAITLAPASNDPARTDLYVTTRGVDNDSQPTENDGVMYELSAPDLGPGTPAGNTAPRVDAGPDATVSLPATAALDGTVTDDGLPNPPGATTATWTQASGPGTVTFTDSHAVDTTASFSLPGTYVLRLSATDGALTTADDVTITVLSSTPGNAAPTVSAGPDQTVVLPAAASLQGTVSDDGLPDPPGATTVSWTRVSGPGTVTFSAPASATTTASFSAAGTYVLRLTASDSALSSSDDVTVVASTAPVTGNLVPNPGFESGTTGWNASGGTLTRFSPGHTGSWAAQLANTSTSTATCQLNDHPDTVASTVTGRYTASMWVLGDAAAAGTTATLRIREYAGSTLVGTTETKLTLGTAWQQVTLTHTVVAPGSHLDLTLRRSTPAAKTCFTVDDIVLTRS